MKRIRVKEGSELRRRLLLKAFMKVIQLVEQLFQGFYEIEREALYEENSRKSRFRNAKKDASYENSRRRR